MICAVCKKRINKNQAVHPVQQNYTFCRDCVCGDLARRFDLLLRDNTEQHQRILQLQNEYQELHDRIVKLQQEIVEHN